MARVDSITITIIIIIIIIIIVFVIIIIIYSIIIIIFIIGITYNHQFIDDSSNGSWVRFRTELPEGRFQLSLGAETERARKQYDAAIDFIRYEQSACVGQGWYH